jgi:outer membrane protein OmpA-like peptidoglycan-associated protein
MNKKIAAAGAMAAALGLAACTTPAGDPNRTGTGALVGALTGAAAGNLIGEDSRGTLIGGALGAAAGAAIGNRLDAQARELEQSLGGTGAGIVNTGSQLIVSLPESITFPTDSDVVMPAFLPSLRSVAQSLQNYPNTTVQVIGHTDSTGSAAYNQGLSERRAQAVTNVLVNSGVPAWRIQSLGRGFNQPVASNDTPQGRAANRRVEIVITPTPQA